MSSIITLPYDPVWLALDWAKKHCPSYITNDVHKHVNCTGDKIHDLTKIDYFFGNKNDAMIFALRWS